jgi:hypothetical protein
VRWLATAFEPVALTAGLIFGLPFIYNSAMGFDPKAAEARLALNLIETTEMPKLAWDALEAGLDGPAIRRLAALEFPTFFQIRDSLPRVMEEMHLMKLGGGEAALHLAKMRAQEVLRSNAQFFGTLETSTAFGFGLTMAMNCAITEASVRRPITGGPLHGAN